MVRFASDERSRGEQGQNRDADLSTSPRVTAEGVEAADDRAIRAAARFSVNDPALQDDPFPLFAEFRKRCPVAWCDEHGGHYIVSRYDDVLAILQDPERFSSRGLLIPDWEFPLGGKQIPLEIDGEAHRLYRVALADMFNPVRVNALEPLMRRTAQRLIGDLSANGGGDLMSEYATPLAAETFLHTFGLPAEVLPDLFRFKDLLVRGGAEGRAELANGTPAVVGLFSNLLEQRRAEGASGADLMSAMLRARFGDRPLTDDEILNISVVLMLASLDTTASGLANILAFLAENPVHRDQLVADESLIPNAIEELLRFEGLLSNGRLVTSEGMVGGTPVHPGDRVMVLFGSTGRDEARYDNPDEVDFTRQNIRHLGFGAGPHRCLGMHLARRTLKVAVEELHRAQPNYHLAENSKPQRTYGHVRGVLNLPVQFSNT